jgi:hypothetical protein
MRSLWSRLSSRVSSRIAEQPVRTWDDRPLVASLLRRSEVPARALGSNLAIVVRERAVGVRPPKLARPARPEPNAPLLMRIVRHPYALSPASGVRITFIDPSERVGPVERVGTAGPGRPFAALLRELGELVLPTAPRPRARWVPRPFERRRGR